MSTIPHPAPPTLAPPARPAAAEMLRDVLDGLSRPQRSLPCKYFYDAHGSELFDRICELPEYYPTRCERVILERHASEMADRFGAGAALVEYGSGSSTKTRLLLDHLTPPATYVPVDICREHLLGSARRLARRYPALEIAPCHADFTKPFDLPRLARADARRVVFFSGSTIGNFPPAEAAQLLGRIARLVGPGGGLLIGVDLRKDHSILEPAYDDAQGVTAAFNLNLLTRLNRELGADFDLTGFRHRARYDPRVGRIEMYLDSVRAQAVHVGGRAFQFAAGEPICTEYSYKYDLPGFADLAAAAGFRVEQVWTDPDRFYSVQFASVT